MTPSDVLSEIPISESEWHAARAVVELTAVVAGGISGALHAIRREYDLVGITVIGVVSGLGGGIVRDLLLSQGPVLALQQKGLLLTAFLGAGAGMLLGQRTAHFRAVFWFFEALALGLFTIAGIQRAEEVGLQVIPAIFLGVASGIGGGLLRDVLCRETPVLLMPGPPYAVSALFGGLTYFGVRLGLDAPTVVCEWLGILAAFGLRALGTWRRWVMPRHHEVRVRFSRWRARFPQRRARRRA